MILVAEFTTNHFGHPRLLQQMLREASHAGADFVKLQRKNVEAFYLDGKLDSPYESPFGTTYREYRTALELSPDTFRQFDDWSRKHDTPWFATVQDIPSLYEMVGYDLPMYKISSCRSTKTEFLREVGTLVPHDKTIVISVAGQNLGSIEMIIDIFPNHPLIINHCVAVYPCPLKMLRLGNIEVLKRKFESDRIKIGYSGHEVGLPATRAVIDMGVHYLERHFCITRNSFVHHLACALEPDEFAQIRTCQQETLPDEAFEVSFGASEQERQFLLDQEYGK
jgi:sialic acid synthase SpsE